MRLLAVLVLLCGCAAEDDNPRYPTPGPSGLQPTNTPMLAAAGGTACIGQSTLCVFIPPAALSEDATVAIRQASSVPVAAAVLASSAFDVSFVPETVTFSGQATLTYQLPSVSLVGHNLGIAYVDVDAWAFNGISSFSHTSGATLDVVTANTNHFTTFAVVDMDELIGCGCDADNTCTAGCGCDPDCCLCDIDATCTAGCACDEDCCGCDVDSSCTGGCGCDPDCVVSDAPDIAVVYAAYEGPSAADCTGGVCSIPVGNALDLGTAAPLGSTAAQLTIANRSACTGACDTCALTVAANPSYWNLGLGFALNEDDAFAFAGAIITPFDILQQSVSCSETGRVNILVSFTAPLIAGDYAGIIVLESNDPDEPIIEIPVVGTSGAVAGPPLAIAGYQSCPGNPCTDPASIAPLDRVYLEGTSSYDPGGGSIASYQWQVISHPGGVNLADLSMQGETTELFSFVVPATGLYDVLLTVVNDNGIASADTNDAHLTVLALGEEDVRIVLTWDTATDHDLHLTHIDQQDLLCNIPFDCFYDNKTPVWFAGDAAGTGANPHMDLDDQNGLGPENVFIDQADAGTYRVYVHYYDSTGGPSNAHVSLVVDGNSYSFNRQLQPQQVWAVADIWWTGIVNVAQEYPTDGGGMGAVATMSAGSCTQPGWDFP